MGKTIQVLLLRGLLTPSLLHVMFRRLRRLSYVFCESSRMRAESSAGTVAKGFATSFPQLPGELVRRFPCLPGAGLQPMRSEVFGGFLGPDTEPMSKNRTCQGRTVRNSASLPIVSNFRKHPAGRACKRFCILPRFQTVLHLRSTDGCRGASPWAGGNTSASSHSSSK